MKPYHSAIATTLAFGASTTGSSSSPLIRNPSRSLELPRNLACVNTNATFLEGNSLVSGSTALAAPTNFACESERRAAFFKIAANGSRYKLTTCHDETNYDSALYVAEGGCSGTSFPCATYENLHDFGCDAQGMGATIDFYSIQDTIYTIAVTGADDAAAGDFGLSLTEYIPPPNDNCEQAEMLEPTADDAPVVIGSTENATYDLLKCDYYARLGVYYQFRGTGGRFRVSTCNNYTNYNSALYIQEHEGNGCSYVGCSELENDNDFECDTSGHGSTIEFLSKEDVMYIVVVRGVLETDRGTFGLTLQEIVRPANDACSEPERIVPKQPNQQQTASRGCARSLTSAAPQNQNDTATVNEDMVIVGSTVAATTSTFRCLAGNYPSVFYSVVGTGQVFRVSTCSIHTDFLTTIQVYAGLCAPDPDACGLGSESNGQGTQDFDCDDSGKASTLEWPTKDGTLYSIAVRGTGEEDMGNFGLTIQAIGKKPTATCRWVQVCD